MNVSEICSRIIRTSFYLLFILVPLILTPWNYELFEYNKMVVTYGLTIIILGSWILKTLADRKVSIAKTPLDIPIALFVISQLISTLFSMDPHVSWLGYYSRFNGGMWSVISYVILYYAFVTHFPPAKKTLNAIVATAIIVALYGVAEHFGIDKHLWVQDVQTRVFSTLGQPNWLAAYLAALLPISLYFFTTGTARITTMQKLKFLFGGATAILFFLVILYTRSRSGLLGIAVADIIFWVLLFFSSKNKKSITLPFVIAHSAFFLIVFFNGIYIDGIDRWVTFRAWKNRITRVTPSQPVTPAVQSGTLLESGGTESGTIRKYVWQGAIDAWRANGKNILVGTGTETFAFAFYQWRPAGHNMTSEWDFLYNKAHNEYLNYLTTTGIFGLGTYLFLIGSFIYWYMGKKVKHDTLTRALFAGWISILITNFFGFSVVIIQLFFFLFPALIIAIAGNTKTRVFPFRITERVYTYSFYTLLLVFLVLLVLLFRYWQADTKYSTGYRLARANQLAQAEMNNTQAIALNPREPLYHDELASTLSSLTIAAFDGKNATLAASLAKQSLTQSDMAIRRSPKNVNFWKTRTKLFYTFSTFDPELNQAAISALETAKDLSPRDPKIAYNLAILYGRQSDNQKAVELLQEAKALKPNYRDAYFGLYVFYTELKQTDLAREELKSYLTIVDPDDKDFQERLNQL